MKKYFVLMLTVLFLFFVVSCGNNNTEKTKIDAQTAYSKLKTGMSYEEVAEILSGFKIVSDSTAESEIMPGQKVVHRMIMWQAGKTFIQITFENGKLWQKQIIEN